MERFIDAVKLSLDNKNWYGALFIALALPDICGRIEEPEKKTGERYINWFNRYLLNKYKSHIGVDLEEKVFLCGEDCYAFRCSYLHQGDTKIEGQPASKDLSNFIFCAPPAAHCNYININNKNILQLDVGAFCLDVANSVLEWVDKEVKNNKIYQDRIQNELIKIHDCSQGLRINFT